MEALTCSCHLPAFSGYKTPVLNNVKVLIQNSCPKNDNFNNIIDILCVKSKILLEPEKACISDDYNAS